MNYEDRATEAVERQTAKVPSLAFMGLAVGAMALSAGLVLMGRKQLGNFVGQWAPTILIMGLYNKLAKEVALPQRGLGGSRMPTSRESGYTAGAGV
jgi:hypothetical protein